MFREPLFPEPGPAIARAWPKHRSCYISRLYFQGLGPSPAHVSGFLPPVASTWDVGKTSLTTWPEGRALRGTFSCSWEASYRGNERTKNLHSGKDFTNCPWE